MPKTALQRHFGVVVPFSICGPARLPIDLRPGKSCLRCLGLEMSKQRNSLQLEDGDLRTSGRLTRKSERLKEANLCGPKSAETRYLIYTESVNKLFKIQSGINDVYFQRRVLAILSYYA